MKQFHIDPEAYYDENSLRVQGFDGDALRKAREAGELRFKRVGRSVIYKGEWLRAWLDQAGGRPHGGKRNNGGAT